MKPIFHKINIRLVGLLVFVLLLISVAGCTGTKEEVQPGEGESVQETIGESVQETIQDSAPETTVPVTTEPEDEGSSEELPPENKEPVPISVSAPEGIKEELYAAICAVRQPAPMEISGVTLSDNPDIDVKNLYYELTRDYPDLKYAYDITAKIEDGFLLCEISYMPYKTGNWPANEDALIIHNMKELLQVAEENIGEKQDRVDLLLNLF